MSKRLHNGASSLVTDCIEGILLNSGGKLARLEYKNTVRVVLRNDEDFKKDKVALVSGGGSGHEPSHAGWLGRGMLSAAVCGDVFASPSTEAVLAAIKAVTGDAGCLVIVKNYTGDRLNFGLAVEKAKASGLKCDILVVGDDVAIEDAPQPRGIAGVVFVHKIAGAAAEKGMSLSEVKHVAETASKNMYSIGMATAVCTIPGAEVSDRLDGDLVEYGLGIHGEPGVQKAPLKSSAETASDLVDRLVKAKASNGPFALLVNNLGTLPPLEMNIVVRDAVRAFEKAQVDIKKIVVLTGMTSLDMTGYSLTLCDLTDTEDYLLAETEAPAWLPLQDLSLQVATVPCPDIEVVTSFQPPSEVTEEGRKMKRLIKAACNAVIKAEPDLTAADRIVGDGDCGTTLKQGAERVVKDLDSYPVDSLSKTLDAIGISAGQSMGGTSGVLYHIGFSAAGAAVAEGGNWSDALAAGTDAISRYGGAKEGMRTMMDALVPATRCKDSVLEAAEAAKGGAEKTKSMGKAGAGRSSYIPAESMQGTADPGATAVGVWLSALADSS
mmetsp:Transcript_10120/g.30928  ORF Transcript_10120/g.30928 Transcript_10120/m.30928 type:complete len:551 (-) Transcript_10120:1312-2964(-)